MSYAINRQSLVKNVLKDKSIAAKSAVTEGNFSNPSTGKDFNADTGNLYPYNVKKAKAYWAKAQQQLGKKKLHIQLMTLMMTSARPLGSTFKAPFSKI